MIHFDIAAILQNILGLRIPSIGTATLERSINRRLRSLKLSSQQEYVALLRCDETELNNFIDEVVISETWFFRDVEPFVALRDRLADRLTECPSQRLRLLSIPCASGEEPYSIIMTLLDEGWRKERFSIDAVDISVKAIVKAKKAVYSKNSFRHYDLKFQDKYFTRSGANFELRKDIARKVRFFHGNILDAAFMEGLGLYDIVFCRNLLIYLDQEAQRRTVASLANLLLPQGVLFVGAAEANIFLPYGFTPTNGSFHYPLFLSAEKKNILQRTSLQEEEPREREVHSEILSHPVKIVDKADSVSEETEMQQELTTAQRLADVGDLSAATRSCEKILDKFGPSADVYYLLGVINNFSGKRNEAIKLLKKALYLESEHEESLVLLCYLFEKLGNKKTAANYKRRLRYIEERQKNNK